MKNTKDPVIEGLNKFYDQIDAAFNKDVEKEKEEEAILDCCIRAKVNLNEYHYTLCPNCNIPLTKYENDEIILVRHKSEMYGGIEYYYKACCLKCAPEVLNDPEAMDLNRQWPRPTDE